MRHDWFGGTLRTLPKMMVLQAAGADDSTNIDAVVKDVLQQGYSHIPAGEIKFSSVRLTRMLYLVVFRKTNFSRAANIQHCNSWG